MRKLAVGLAGVVCILATPARAQDRAAYMGGGIGVTIVQDMGIDFGPIDDAVTVEHELGYQGGLFVGYDLGNVRLEAEGAYRKADLDSYRTKIRLPLEGAVFPPEREAGGGASTALSLMVNGMGDFGDEDRIAGFVGGGVGVAKVEADGYRTFSNATPFLDNSESPQTKFAWQLFAGARRAVRGNVDVTVKYNFFNVDGLGGVAFNGVETHRRFRSHSFMAGFVFTFGGS